MSDTSTKAHVSERRTVTVTVEKVNRGGLLAEEIWHNYGRIFKGEPIPKDAVGTRVELTEVYSEKEDKWYIASFRVLSDESPAEPVAAEADDEPEVDATASDAKPGEGQAPRPAKPEALKYAEDLALKAGISSETLEQIVQLRFGKAFGSLTVREASQTIEFFDGYRRTGGNRFSKRS